MRYIKIVSVGAGIGAFALLIGGWALMATLFSVRFLSLRDSS